MDAIHNIGFLGLGQMGAPMAERLLDSGIALHVHDPAANAVEVFRNRGAIVHASPKAVADAAELVFACLPSPSVSKNASLGEDGAIHGGSLRVYVEMSTIGSACVEAIASGLSARDVLFVDAPISGGPKGARAGALTIMAAGAPEAVAIARPWLERIGRAVYVIDTQPGRAQVLKLVNNLISAAIMASSFETVVMGAKAGLDPDLMIEVLNASSARNSATLQKIPDAILPGTFDFGATVNTIFKDIELALEEARRLGVPMWTGQAVAQIWRFAKTQGAGDLDYTSLIRFMEGWAGIEVRSRR